MVLAKKGNSGKKYTIHLKAGRQDLAQCVGELQAREYWG